MISRLCGAKHLNIYAEILVLAQVKYRPLADLRGAPGTPPPGGPNSFIFMQFSGKKLKNNSTFGSWRPSLGKILDPPL